MACGGGGGGSGGAGGGVAGAAEAAPESGECRGTGIIPAGVCVRVAAGAVRPVEVIGREAVWEGGRDGDAGVGGGCVTEVGGSANGRPASPAGAPERDSAPGANWR